MVDRTPHTSEALASAPAPDVQATFCATLVDEWLRLGVRHAVVAPGSRSTPMALALAARSEIAIHVVHDERVAGFVALGLGLGGSPALLLCTSGTAAANFFPAVVEAGLSAVPMIVLTADRPEELRNVGAPQTIDQIELYGSHVRWFHDPDVPVAASFDSWRPLAGQAWLHAQAGPVQLNLPFREPLVGTPLALPDPMTAPSTPEPTLESHAAPADFDRQRGVILVGGASGVDPDDVARLHQMTQWPIIADAMSAMRHLDGAISTADALLRHERFAADHAPDVIVRVGRPASSKVLAQWSGRDGITMVQVGGPGRIDPDHNVSAVCSMATLLDAAPTGATGTTWLTRWRRADERAGAAIAQALTTESTLSEPGVARCVADHLPADAGLTVASSMPVRDLEWFGGRQARCHCNRGANGIDGVMSTAVGRALESGRPEFVLIGDFAFVHDSNALVALATRPADLRVVVVDNDGGGIFSFLPQATALDHGRFEQLFGTPLGSDVLAVAAAHGLATVTATSRDELAAQMTQRGPWVCRVPSDRAANVEVHAALHAAATAALD
ncbi:2-succinyl-5-enolpyruvyl-6-hydroxy-3-cyclohexene-1-carboxylic-acid synthase [Ilumatobacter coccineus]|uniref:2-succinyl-5-enolpyruvyl-6-hydroxy-3-cyclohexene-1-carboxylate synthase n=1 Tax=Ilumatobacter coccineus (strain NBRC 103263 / KCTC 29153 / YM16-304) TaxID=1313172 RepID=A0A6C7EC53_ILUCY|nr:2-succinyl-5-enolpyruvyl-6-hydroxy-3-cyclohexene-1-carboxylic-acid synthase [Ilumatobacter coccineus]BAN02715.1 2-succinyl-5-enolpyruvyl-6-hydroxy-3-cyclohexene-1-carboxylate synthase [Ilumatobacter coccineus YM16-304]